MSFRKDYKNYNLVVPNSEIPGIEILILRAISKIM